MKISGGEWAAVLGQFNPWWRREPINDLPNWRRAACSELHKWIVNPPAPRAVLLSGARQIGKTTLLLQSIAERLASGVPPGPDHENPRPIALLLDGRIRIPESGLTPALAPSAAWSHATDAKVADP